MNNLFKKKTGEEEENEGLLFNEYRASAWEDKNVLEIAGHGGCTTMCIYLTSIAINLKMINMI